MANILWIKFLSFPTPIPGSNLSGHTTWKRSSFIHDLWYLNWSIPPKPSFSFLHLQPGIVVFQNSKGRRRPAKWRSIIDVTEVQVNVNIPPHPTPNHAWRSIIHMMEVQVNVNIPPHPTPTHAWRSIIDMTEVQVNVNIPPHPTPAHPTKTRPEWEENTKTRRAYGKWSQKNARDHATGRNNQGPYFSCLKNACSEPESR